MVPMAGRFSSMRWLLFASALAAALALSCSSPKPCANGCCNGTTCVIATSQSSTLCGISGEACAACLTGKSCQSGMCRESCNASSCATGCCDASGNCVTAGGSCGKNGDLCKNCGLTNDTCVALPDGGAARPPVQPACATRGPRPCRGGVGG